MAHCNEFIPGDEPHNEEPHEIDYMDHFEPICEPYPEPIFYDEPQCPYAIPEPEPIPEPLPHPELFINDCGHVDFPPF